MLELIIVTLAGVVAKLKKAKKNDGVISEDEWAEILCDLGDVIGTIVRHRREQRKAERAARGGGK